MNASEMRKELCDILLRFVKRVASDKNATAEEMEVLPTVAHVLADLLDQF